MKWITCLCSTLCLFAVQSAIAAVPVTMSGPTPAIVGSYNTGDSNTFTYTITNNVPNKSFPITVSGLSGPVSRTNVSNDCGSSLPKGPSTCSIGILIAPTAGNEGLSFNQTLSVHYQGRTPLVNNILFSVGSTGVAVLTAAGKDNSSGFPLLAVSTDSANTWAVQSVSGLPANGEYRVSSCTGSGSTAICIAAGEESGGIGPPLLAVSTNGGNSWAVISVLGITTSGYFHGASCTGSGSTAICVAAGRDNSGSGPPLLAVSINGGNTWALKSVTGSPANGIYYRASCTGTGSTAICIAAGEILSSSAPLLAVSTDGGNTWAVKSISGIPVTGVLASASCIGSGSTAICTAGGREYAGILPPLLTVSTDGGNTWAVKSVTGLPATSGLFRSTSCTGSGSTAVCTAVGEAPTNTTPLLAASTDGGNTWAVKSVVGLPVSGQLFGTSCTGSGSTAICTAAGQDATGTGPPLVIVSVDGGITWIVKSVTGNPITGTNYATSCTGHGSTAICTAAGAVGGAGTTPILTVSTDGGNSWALKSIAGIPASGYFSAAGATGGS